MNSGFIAVAGAAAFILAYRYYSRHLEKLFGVDKVGETPAHKSRDNVDFVPANRGVLFGHHFASIAGLGPITGPAIAVIWGWVPALVWVILGTIFLGAVHDYAAIAISLKHGGKSIGDLTGAILGPRGRVLFLIVVFFLLALSMGVFALVVAQIFTLQYPQTVIPVFALIAVAAGAGYTIYKTKVGIFPATMVGLALTFLSVWAGIVNPASMHRIFMSAGAKAAQEEAVRSRALGADANAATVAAYFKQEADKEKKAIEEAIAAGTAAADTKIESSEAYARNAQAAADVSLAGTKAANLWVYILLAYAFAASVLPVWLLLQPRDYLNSFQLYIGIGALFIALLVTHPNIVAPAYRSGAGLPSVFPLLFITVACGAISGFHSLVASGTTARQLNRAADARPIVYGAMLVEGALALIAVLACSAGVGTLANWEKFYPQDIGKVSATLSTNLAAFFYGSGSFLEVFGIPSAYGQVLVAVVVVGFAMTTLDTGTRLLRYNIEELADTFGMRKRVNRYLASLIAVGCLAMVALFKVPAGVDAAGKTLYKPAGFIVWQLFGTANQLLACLGLLIVTVYLIKLGKPSFYTAIPFAFMLLVTGWSLVQNIVKAWHAENPTLRSWPIVTVGSILTIVTAWLAVEALLAVARYKSERRAAGAA